jgi:hypothetical protein
MHQFYFYFSLECMESSCQTALHLLHPCFLQTCMVRMNEVPNVFLLFFFFLFGYLVRKAKKGLNVVGALATCLVKLQ